MNELLVIRNSSGTENSHIFPFINRLTGNHKIDCGASVTVSILHLTIMRIDLGLKLRNGLTGMKIVQSLVCFSIMLQYIGGSSYVVGTVAVPLL